MSRKCCITGRKGLSGNSRSKSNHATKRTQNINLQKFTIDCDGKKKTMRISVRGYRTLMKRMAKKNKNRNENNNEQQNQQNQQNQN